MYKYIKKSDFLGNVFVLISGTVFAQIISYLLSPLISRLYTPEEMSFLTLLIRISSFLAVISTARYDLAFPIPKRVEHAFSLYKFTFSFTLLFVLISIMVICLLQLLNIHTASLKTILNYIPISLFLISLNSQGINWAIRTKDFQTINTSKILQSTVNSVLCVLFGYLSFGTNGLLLSFLLSLIISNLPFLLVFFKTYKKLHNFKYKGRKFVALKSFSNYPKINLPHVLMDLTKDLFVAFYLISIFDKDILGLYDFSYRMLRLPINLIGVSIGQVLFKKTVDLLNDKKPVFPFIRKIVILLFIISIIPFTTLFFWGEEIFSLIFGSNWKMAGKFSEIMSPWLMVNFIVSPLSQIPSIFDNQKKFFIVSLISSGLLIFTLLINTLFPNLNLVFIELLKIISIGQFLSLSFLLFWILRLVKSRENINLKEI